MNGTNESQITNHKSLLSRLFDPVDIVPLVFFRIVFGFLAFADVCGVWVYYHLMKDFFNPEKFQFKYYGCEWAVVFPEPFMSLMFWVAMISAICIMLGKYYRVATVVFAFCFTWFFLMEKSIYLNHGYLFCWISWIMVFLPANQKFSGDVLKNPKLGVEKVARWSVWIFPFFMGLVYFYGGLAKINMDWLTGSPLNLWLKNVSSQPILGHIWGHEITPYIMAWGGMLLDLTAAFFLLFKKTRKWILGFILLFHVTNTFIFQIGIFPWLSICLSLMFFPEGEMRKWFNYLEEAISNWPETFKKWKSKLSDIKFVLPPAFVFIGFSVFLSWVFYLNLEKHTDFDLGKNIWLCLAATVTLYTTIILLSLLIYFLVKKFSKKFEGISYSENTNPLPPVYPRKAVVSVLSVVILFHLLIPFRHHLFEGNVAWTEEGHRYSWRMMLRSKRGYGGMHIVDFSTGKRTSIKLRDYLTSRQVQKVRTHPDMILQFAHYLEKKWREEKGVEEFGIYAKFRVKLNGRQAQPFTDPEVDLTKKEWHFFKESDWIMPFDPSREKR